MFWNFQTLVVRSKLNIIIFKDTFVPLHPDTPLGPGGPSWPGRPWKSTGKKKATSYGTGRKSGGNPQGENGIITYREYWMMVKLTGRPGVPGKPGNPGGPCQEVNNNVNQLIWPAVYLIFEFRIRWHLLVWAGTTSPFSSQTMTISILHAQGLSHTHRTDG